MLRPGRNRRNHAERIGNAPPPNNGGENEPFSATNFGQNYRCERLTTAGKRSREGKPGPNHEQLLKEPQQVDTIDEFDEYGTELHRDARIWKVYVKETDKWDADLVKGWNDSTDVILIFVSICSLRAYYQVLKDLNQAALFSAISTAFLIESSKTLEEDPSETTSQTLLVISQTLLSIANGTQQGATMAQDLPSVGPTEFRPSRTAVWVNTLWYLSLSLSLATSFIAILAKDWCHSFMTGRTGHPFSQTHRRQQKWDMIERWKMSELLAVLPSLIHVALFLFSIGLCIHLWDAHIIVAIPVICVSAVAFGFYLCSSVAAIIFDYFPYQTIISRLCRTQAMERALQFVFWMACQLPRLFGYAILWIARFIVGTLAVLFGLPSVLWLEGYLSRWQKHIASSLLIVQLAAWPLIACLWIIVGPASIVFILLAVVWDEMESTANWIKAKFSRFKEVPAWLRWYSRLVLRRASGDSKRGNVMSLALSWLIKNCEVPQSVDIALQSIAGAGKNFSRTPLEECDATLEILRRLASSNLYRGGNAETAVSLYSRALSFLSSPMEKVSTSLTADTGGDLEVMIWDLQTQVESNVASLITDGQFKPSPNNLSALRIGNTAASRSLQLLRDNNEDSTDLFRSILESLDKHLGREDILHPSSLLSLLSAASLFSLCADNATSNPLLWTLCLHLVEDGGYSSSPLVRMTAIACALFQGRGSKQGQWGQQGGPSHVEEAVRTLIDFQSRSEEDLAMMAQLGLRELLSSLDDDDICDPETHAQIVKIQRDVGRFRFQMQPGATGSQENVQRYLQALHDMYLSKSIVEPAADHYVFVLECICRTPANRRLCWELLSKFRCPDLCQLATYLDWRSIVPLLVRATKTSDEPTGALTFTRAFWLWNPTETEDKQMKFFATAQLWLFFTLCLASSTNEPSRIALQEQLRSYSPGEEIVEAHRERLREQMVESWENSSDIITGELGVYAFRLLECAYQLHNLSVPQQVIDGLRNVPLELRGLSSFAEWQTEPNKAPTDQGIHAHTPDKLSVDERNTSKVGGLFAGAAECSGLKDAEEAPKQGECLKKYPMNEERALLTEELNAVEAGSSEMVLAMGGSRSNEDAGGDIKDDRSDDDHISIDMSKRNS